MWIISVACPWRRPLKPAHPVVRSETLGQKGRSLALGCFGKWRFGSFLLGVSPFGRSRGDVLKERLSRASGDSSHNNNVPLNGLKKSSFPTWFKKEHQPS